MLGAFEMGRYACTLNLPGDREHLRLGLQELLSRRQFATIYDSPSYCQARETAGNVSLSQQVTVELFWDAKVAGEVELTCVAKNGELPLQADNHCQQVFETMKTALQEFQAQVQQ